MLVDQQDRNVLPLAGEAVEGGFDGAVFGLCIDDEEVLLCVWGLRHVLLSSVVCSRESQFLWRMSPMHSWQGLPLRSRWRLTPTPARSMPVTVSCRALASPSSSSVQGTKYLIANHGEELPVFVRRGRGCHGVLFASCSCGEACAWVLRAMTTELGLS